jgi:arginase family enzyme
MSTDYRFPINWSVTDRTGAELGPTQLRRIATQTIRPQHAPSQVIHLPEFYHFRL